MSDIRIGTSGFDYLDWQGPFYPENRSRREFFDHYCDHFDTVELNFSYYRMPDARQLGSFVDRSGGKVDFAIKAHQSLTHRVVDEQWRDQACHYRQAVQPMLEAGLLAAVLLQFPFSFHYQPENRQYLDRLIHELAGLPLVVEFRNAAWFNSRVFEGLRHRQVGLCCIDAPVMRGLPPAMDVVTGNPAYVRFHGRNASTWWSGDAASRFDYLYSRDELEGWVARLRTMAAGSEHLRIYFNNHRRGQAPTNAQMLRELMSADGLL